MDISKFAVEKYFGKNPGAILIKHLINSYNDFVLCKIGDVIEGFNRGPIEIPYQFIPDDNCHKYILKFFVKNPVLAKPIIVEKDGSTKIMTPADARNRGFTYASNLYVDLYLQAHTFNEETKTYHEENKKICNINLGKIPIMVKSKYCILSENSHHIEDECKFDYGGYFIVNGTEKVVIPQDRIAENKIYVFPNNKNTTYSHIAEIRSVLENKFSVPKTSTMKLTSKPNQFGRAIRVTIHHIKHDIPVTVLFRALGVQTDKDIVNYVLLHETDNKLLQTELIGSFEEGSVVSCQRDAYEYLNKYMVINGYNKEIHSFKEKRLQLITDILKFEFLPHVGTDFHKKALFLGVMMNKLIKCFVRLTPFDDRDSYINKRVDTPGVLMANLFRQYYGKVIKDMKVLVGKDLNSPTWKNSSKLINVVNNINIAKLFKSTVIDSGMRFGLATGNWGIKTSKTKQGVAQVLNRLTYNATLSHLRRINTPIEKTGKLIQPRKLHSTQHGIICPAETPEGISVGLVKNMSLVAGITVASNSLTMRDYLVNGHNDVKGVTLFIGNNLEIFTKEAVRIIVNGDHIGVHSDPPALFQMMKQLKRTGVINSNTSIAWHVLKNEMIFCTEGGRCIRPLMIVNQPNNMCSIDDEFVKNNASIEWVELCSGNDPKIEYMDVEEVNTSMVSMTFANLTEHKINAHSPHYSHLELNPSMMLGVLAASIPFSNHNQAPRNCYQCLWIEEEVLMADSTRKKIKDVMVGEEVMTFDTTTMVPSISKVVNQYVRTTEKKVFEITTISGRKIVATSNHPLMTNKGRVKVEDMNVGDCIGIYMNDTNYVSNNVDEYIVLDKESFAKNLEDVGVNPTLIQKHTKKLTDMNILPLTSSHAKLPTIARMIGLLGTDGAMNVYNKKHGGMTPQVQANFGQPLDAEMFEEDAAYLGFGKSNPALQDRVIHGSRHITWKISHNGVMASLFVALEMHIGNKTLTERKQIPNWIMNGSPLVKKEFLSGWQGGDGNKIYLKSGCNTFCAMPVYQSILPVHETSLIHYMEQLGQLYTDNGIKVTTVKRMSTTNILYGKFKIGVYFGQSDDNYYNIAQLGYRYCMDKVVASGKIMEYIKAKQLSHVDELFKDFKERIESKAYSIFVPIASKVEVPNVLISDITVASENHSFITTSGVMSFNSAMGKQAIGVYASNFRNRYDTVGHVLNYPQRPIVQTDMAHMVNNDSLPCGANVIVAIMTFRGYNQEDSVMFNESAINRGLFMSTHYKTYKDINNKNHSTGEEEEYGKPDPITTKNIKPFNYDKLESNGFVKANTFVESGDVLIGKYMPNKDGNIIHKKDSSVVMKNNESGYVDSNFNNEQLNVNGDGYTFTKVRLRNMRIPCIGDKFCLPKEAEVLVQEDGEIYWETINNVVAPQRVLQLNPDDDSVEFADISATFEFQHNGDMIRFKGDGVDLITTEEHKMVVMSEDELTPVFKLAKEMTGKETFYAGCNVIPSQVADDATYMEEMAYMYGLHRYRGNVETFGKRITGNVWIFKTERLLSILDKHGIVYNCEQSNRIISINDMGIAVMFEGMLIQQWVLDSKKYASCFIEGYFQDDELFEGKPNADMIQLIGMWAGQNIVVHQDKNNSRMFHLHRGTKFIKDFEITREKFKGKVYCIEVPSHMFMVRMNGKCLWTGNSSRHGQKGTVGMVYKQEDMPFTKDGIVPDIIVNPHAIPSRMTIAQLMECIMSKAGCAHGSLGNGSPFQDLAVEDISKALELGGFERHGNEIMYNPQTGEQIETDIFIGPTFYQRLKHMVNDKIHSRSSCGPVQLFTRQPTEGRLRDGGLRDGEMEVGCKKAHGMSAFLKERLMECSDNYKVFVCKTCKTMATVNPEKNIYLCKKCKNTTLFAEVRIPYAAKLLFQEAETMSIGTRFTTT